VLLGAVVQVALDARAREALSSERLSALATAVATSSVNSAICDSVSTGNGASPLHEAAITPQRRPPTTIGQPIDERIPSARASCASGPEACAKLSTRTGPLVSRTSAAMLVPSSAKRVPTASSSSSPPLHAATPVTVPSDS
jgi:hypothetical protein